MPRPRRAYLPGLSVHVYQRGANKGTVFHDDADRRRFLTIAKRATRSNGVDVHGFVLMSTHYHMVATPQDQKSLSATFRDLDGQYSKYYNWRYERVGPVWNGRFGASLLRHERYWLSCLRYVEWNPVKASLVVSAESYPWSSYRAHALGEKSDWLVLHPLYLSLGLTPSARQEAYRAICACGA